MAYRVFNEAFTVDGEWYLPDEPGNKVSGRLEYRAGRIELQLQAALQPLHGDIRVGDRRGSYDEVHGATEEGEAVTLLTVQRISVSIRFGSGGLRQPERCSARMAIFGGHAGGDTVYKRMRFRVPALQVWLARPAIHDEQIVDAGGEVGRQTFHILGLTKESCAIPSIGATLEWQYSRTGNADPYTSVSATVSGWFVIVPDAPRDVRWYLEQRETTVAMLSLLAGSPMAADCMTAAYDEELMSLDILVANPAVTRFCTHKDPEDFFLPKSLLGDSWREVITKWFEVQARVLEPRHLALSVLNSESLWLHVEFLSLMQALEGLHRALHTGLYVTDEDYEPVKKALGDAIPAGLGSDHKDALRSRIRYGNQVSLRKRLAELVGTLSEPIRLAILGAIVQLPRSWIDTRNYYTHWDETLKENVLDTQGIFDANVRMRHLLRVLYARLMGVPTSAIEQALDQNSRSDSVQHLLQLNIAEQRRRDPSYGGGVLMTISKSSGVPTPDKKE